MLDQLPEDILVNVLSRLDDTALEETLRTLPSVGRSWSQTFGCSNTAFWVLLAKSRGFSIGRRHAKKCFFRRPFQQKQAQRIEGDQTAIRIIHRLKKSDCVAYIRKQTAACPTIIHHRISSREHRTLLHYASWYGRTKTIQFLLQEDQLSLLLELDDSNASPLLLAAWAGNARVVRVLLKELSTLPEEKRRHY